MSGAKSHKESSAKSGKAASCQAGSGDPCLSDARRADLFAEFGIEITNVNATGYTKNDNTFIQSIGVQAPEADNRLMIDSVPLQEFMNSRNVYSVPLERFKCIGEAYALAASACDNDEKCTYFSVNLISDTSGSGKYVSQFRFFSDDSVTKLINSTDIEVSPSFSGFDQLRAARVFTAFLKDESDPPEELLPCEVPPSTQAVLAFTCLEVFRNTADGALPPGRILGQFNGECCGANAGNDCSSRVDQFNAQAPLNFTQEDYCDCGPGVGGDLEGGNLVTDDFVQYIAPVAFDDCLNTTQVLEQCLTCATKFLNARNLLSRGSDTCGGSLICEPDDALNFITANNCTDGIQTDDCVCDACGDVCRVDTTCTEKIQTALSCQLGSPAVTVENDEGAFVDSGSCLNSLDGTDFSCPSSN